MQQPVFVYGSCTQLGCICVSYEDTEFFQRCLCCHMKNHHAKYVVSGEKLIPIPTAVVQNVFGMPAQQPQLSPSSLSSPPGLLNELSSPPGLLNEPPPGLLGQLEFVQNTLKDTSIWSDIDKILNVETNSDIDNIIDSPRKMSFESETFMLNHNGDIDVEEYIKMAAESLFNFIKNLEAKGQVFLTSSDLNNFYLKHPDMKDNMKLAGGLKNLIFKYHWNFSFIIDREKKKEMIKTKGGDTFRGDTKFNYDHIINENIELYLLAIQLLEDHIKNIGEDNGKVIRADRDMFQFYIQHPEMKEFFQKFGGLISFCVARKGNFFPFKDFKSNAIMIKLTTTRKGQDAEIENSSVRKDLINDVYSTKLDINSFTKEQLSRAAQIAKEIESNSNMHNTLTSPEDLDVCLSENTLRISQIIRKYLKAFGDRIRLDALGLLYLTYPEAKQVIHDVGGLFAFCALFPSQLKVECDSNGIKYLLSVTNNHKQKSKTDDCSSDSDTDWKIQKKSKKNNLKSIRKEGQVVAESLFLYISQKENKKLREKDLQKFYTLNPLASKVVEDFGGIFHFCEEFPDFFKKPVVDLQNGGIIILIRRTIDRYI